MIQGHMTLLPWAEGLGPLKELLRHIGAALVLVQLACSIESRIGWCMADTELICSRYTSYMVPIHGRHRADIEPISGQCCLPPKGLGPLKRTPLAYVVVISSEIVLGQVPLWAQAMQWVGGGLLMPEMYSATVGPPRPRAMLGEVGHEYCCSRP